MENAKLISKVRAWGAAVGPYVLLEAVMPGGTLMALLLYLYRKTKCASC